MVATSKVKKVKLTKVEKEEQEKLESTIFKKYLNKYLSLPFIESEDFLICFFEGNKNGILTSFSINTEECIFTALPEDADEDEEEVTVTIPVKQYDKWYDLFKNSKRSI